MARARRLIRCAFAAFLICLFGVSSVALAAVENGNGTYTNQGAALAACQADARASATSGATFACVMAPNGNTYNECVLSSGGPDPTRLEEIQRYVDRMTVTSSGSQIDYGSYKWCVPATCNAYDSGSPSQQWGSPYANGDVACSEGCLSTFRMGGSGIGSIQFQNGEGGAWGHFVGNTGGPRCQSPTDASMLKTTAGKMMCDHGGVSCYNAQRGFCGTTEYGEQVCTPDPGANHGACAAGATGAMCVGNNVPPPPPPDPPVPNGKTPDSSATATGKDAGGNTYNYTTNNYSGTSPGPGSTSTGSDPSGTSQSNTSGSGNSPGPTGGQGTNSTGKCPDGSVPTASGCSGSATDNGCSAPPQAFGDAIMAAQFKELVAIRCNTAKPAGAMSVGDPSAALAAAGVPADGGASTDPSASGLVSSSDIGQDGFDSSGLGFSRSCPANPVFNVLGHSYTFDLTPFCNFASLLGWFVLLVGFLVGLRIVATGKA